MFECQESDHNQQEITYACLNMNCQIKRACCIMCIEKHNQHKNDLKTINQITKWKKTTIQSYEIYSKKITQIVEIMGQAEKYLSSLGRNLETSFDEIMNEEFEQQVNNLLSIQQLQTTFNQLTSNLESLMEPISQIFSKVEESSKETFVKVQPIVNKSNDKQSIKDTEQIIQKEKKIDQIDQVNQEIKKKKKNIQSISYLDLVEKTIKLRKGNDFDIHQYPIYYQQQIEKLEEYKTIILIGTQNSKKQNLINLFVNYYYGVEFSDPYRFEIIDDIDITKEKQNNEYEQMKVYYIPPQDGQTGLRIIYTPDYSDDLCYDDQKIFDKILSVISNSVSLNQNILIGFVIPQQIQIGTFFMLESILSKFSFKLIKNIVFLFPDSTDECPKQKEILQSQEEIINGIPSPIFQMIPKMNNFWYLKFNTTALFIENKTQDNQISWEIGKNNFQLLLQNYLQNKFDYNKLQVMINKYNEFININFSVSKNQLNQKFQWLYKRDNFYEEYEENIYKQWKALGANQYYKDNTYFYSGKQDEVKQKMERLMQYIQQYQKLIQEQKLKIETYDKEFEEFYDLFKNLANVMQQDYNPWRLYFKFHAILITINRCQWKYYEHLIQKEQNLKLEGWENRVKLLNKTSKFFQYSDGYSGMLNLDQRIKEWSDKYLTLKSKSFYVYSFTKYGMSSDYLYLYDKEGQSKEFYQLKSSETIKYRIQSNCQSYFDEFTQKIWEYVLS
ncbi:unnamed protein product [Paramecium pentaurelia]|uniref:Uncharacterized protein n=1 Tax=Paramecium pentaurelia TaxID=43138 RepID=A0A8S1W713_9CILI|nr:unnamed protein product [Paramecium pentaurelia]